MSSFHTLTFLDIQAIVLGRAGKKWNAVLEAINDNGVDGEALAGYMKTPESLYNMFNNEMNCQVNLYIIKQLYRLICKAAKAKNDALFGAGNSSTTSKEPPIPKAKRKVAATYSTPTKENEEKEEGDNNDQDDHLKNNEPPLKRTQPDHSEAAEPTTWCAFSRERKTEICRILKTAQGPHGLVSYLELQVQYTWLSEPEAKSIWHSAVKTRLKMGWNKTQRNWVEYYCTVKSYLVKDHEVFEKYVDAIEFIADEGASKSLQK